MFALNCVEDFWNNQLQDSNVCDIIQCETTLVMIKKLEEDDIFSICLIII